MEQENTKKKDNLEKELEEPGYENVEQAITGILKQDSPKIYIQNLYDISGIYAGDHATFENIELNSTKKKKSNHENILETEKKFCSWLKDNYQLYSMALMIASAVFEQLPYEWIVQAAEELYLSFEEPKGEAGKRYAITELLDEFCAEICPAAMNTYTGKVSIEVISFENEEYPKKILEYVWRECPQLHEKIVLWLKSYSMDRHRKMSAKACQAFSWLAYKDYYYFQSQMIGMVERDKSIGTDMLVAKTMLFLNEYREYQTNVQNLMNCWNEDYNIHYLLINLLICAEQNEKTQILQYAIHRYVYEAIKAIEQKQNNQWLKNIYNFYASGMRAYTFYRILIEKMYELMCRSTSQSQKTDICDLFLRMFAVDIDLLKYEKGKDAILIKLCLSKNQVNEKICYLWQMVWRYRSFRQAFYKLLAAYIKKQQCDNSTEHLKKFIEKALGTICTEEIQRDICLKIQRRIENE